MRPRIVIGNFYHVLNRGVDKRKIFLDNKDYFRFIHDLFEFNDVQNVYNVGYFLKNIDVGRQYIDGDKDNKRSRKLLVNIHAFCLMPNHYHLLLSQVVDNGISKFIKKLNGGYSKYFNERYERDGSLFQGRYKCVSIQKDSHFLHIPYYIHLNPLDLYFPEWREKKISNHSKAIAFLENYKWSSHLDYLGKKNFPSVTQRKFLEDFWSGKEEYRKSIYGWLKNLDSFDGSALE